MRRDFNNERAFVDFDSSEARPLSAPRTTFDNGMAWEMDDKGNHRVLDIDGAGGRWALYESPAIAPTGDYVVFTQYYIGDLPTETLLALQIIPRAT